MKYLKILLISFAFSAPFTVYCQEEEENYQLDCGTAVSEEVFDQLSAVEISEVPLEFVDEEWKVTTEDVKIQFHIVCSGNSSTAPISLPWVALALSQMNLKFASSGIHFVECHSPRYILNSSYYNLPFAVPAAETVLGSNDISNTINVYIVNKIGNGGYGGYTYAPGGGNRRVFLAANGSTYSTSLWNGLILSHEMGHFFGLLHTNGYGGAGYTNELVNGSNSTTAGDLISDTPADPAQMAWLDGTNCVYPYGSPNCSSTPPFCDANNQVYQPLGDNLMFPTVCGVAFNSFTAGQCQRIWSTYLTYFQNFLGGAPDLMSKDHVLDGGLEPSGAATWNSNGWYDIFKSPDVWNCNTSSTCLTNQKPTYGSSGTNYVRVRVKNNGCSSFTGSATLHAYWTIGSTGETWPNSWFASTSSLCGHIAGDEIANSNSTYGQSISTPLAADAETILTFPWTPVNPNTQYPCLPLILDNAGDPVICLLARLVSSQDPINNETTGSVGTNILNSNNIASRNTALLYIPPTTLGIEDGKSVTVFVRSTTSGDADYDLHIVDALGTGEYFPNGGAIVVTLDPLLWDNWTANGSQGTGVSIYSEIDHQVSITSEHAILSDISVPEDTLLQTSFNFYLTDSSVENSHEFAFFQTFSGESEMTGSAMIFDVIIGSESEERHLKNGADLATDALVFPNPTNRNVTLKFGLEQSSTVSISVVDITGKVLETVVKDQLYNSGEYSQLLNLASYRTGVYFIKLKTGEQTKTLKVSVQNK